MFKKTQVNLIYIIVGLTAVLIGCQSKTTKKFYRDTGELLSVIEYNKNGQKDGKLHEYYMSGELKTLEYYKNGKLVDTTIGFSISGRVIVKRYEVQGNDVYEEYYENGQLFSKGKIKDTIKEGWWDYYDKEGNLDKKIEFVDAYNDSSIRDRQYPNQVLSFDKKQEILKDSSNYYTIQLKDTIPLGKLTLGYIDLEPQISKESDFYMVYFWSEDKNGNMTKIDSTYGKNEKKAEFWLVPKTIGKHKVSGYILEKGKTIRANNRDTTLVDVIELSRKLFFNKVFYVSDSI